MNYNNFKKYEIANKEGNYIIDVNNKGEILKEHNTRSTTNTIKRKVNNAIKDIKKANLKIGQSMKNKDNIIITRLL